MLKWISSWTLFWSIGSINFLNFPIWFKAQNPVVFSVLPADEWLFLWWWLQLLLSSGDLKLKLWQVPSLYHEFFVFHVSPITSLMMSQAFSLSHFRINYFCCHLDFYFPQIHLAAFSVISHTDISIYICLCVCVTCVCMCTYILSLI